nr:hypothetical protein [Kofleriaceae bacterium]
MIAARALALAIIALAACASTQTPAHAPPAPPGGRVVAIRSADGTPLAATYFAAVGAGPHPAALLLPQSDRTRRSWDAVAAQLAAAGIDALAVDVRGRGDSGRAPLWTLPDDARQALAARWPDDVDAALAFLRAQPGVSRDRVGVAGAGSLGVGFAVDAAVRHPDVVVSLVLMSGEAERAGTEFLRHADQLPELFVVSDDDEYPPTQDAMKLLYLAASSARKQLVRYAAPQDAPWLDYETSNPNLVAAHGAHGTDLFGPHPELASIVVHWFATSLAPAQQRRPPIDALAAAETLRLLETPGGTTEVAARLAAARARDPGAQLWPEVAGDLVGEHFERAGDLPDAIAVFELDAVAYPDSADAQANLADAYLAAGNQALAHDHAARGLALLDAGTTPASSWSDTAPRRAEIRRELADTLAKSR